eukprot:TRINITY_DN75_c0_g1_i1.p1 TRINITY_DN75_c0_g1~~TRINITY_DN75_c0_g1_i1.p1  ORF type:complete len:845 (-),score=269.77 TRINITY_DN75_c0_g1_i1:108-2642(-)
MRSSGGNQRNSAPSIYVNYSVRYFNAPLHVYFYHPASPFFMMRVDYWHPPALPAPSDAERSNTPQVKSPMSGWPLKKRHHLTLRNEAAGDAFEGFLLSRYAPKVDSRPSSPALPVTPPEDRPTTPDADSARFEGHAKKRSEKKLQDYNTEDPYIVLGLSDKRWRATEDDIKKAYRKMVLLHHPDKKAHRAKSADADDDEGDAMFKSITRAFDILSNFNKRRGWDSSEPFDNTYPTGSCDPAKFYDVYGPVFFRNSKWAVDNSILLLGDDNTPYDQVVKFYDAWFSFKSWRDFSYLDEYDPEDAESRDEKRWMERQNERERAKRRKEEAVRVNTFVSNAYARDPRLKRRKEELKAAKNKAKEDKLAEIRRVQEEQARKEQEERDREKAKLDDIRKQKEREKAALSKARSVLRRQYKDALSTDTTSTDVEFLCGKCETLVLRALAQAIQANPSAVNEIIREKAADVRGDDPAVKAKAAAAAAAAKEAAAAQAAKAAEEVATGRGWSEDELSFLAQATAKFPGGTGNRWRLIAQFINDKTGGDRTVKEIVAKTQDVKQAATLDPSLVSSGQNKDAFSRFKENVTEKRAQKHGAVNAQAPDLTVLLRVEGGEATITTVPNAAVSQTNTVAATAPATATAATPTTATTTTTKQTASTSTHTAAPTPTPDTTATAPSNTATNSTSNNNNNTNSKPKAKAVAGAAAPTTNGASAKPKAKGAKAAKAAKAPPSNNPTSTPTATPTPTTTTTQTSSAPTEATTSTTPQPTTATAPSQQPTQQQQQQQQPTTATTTPTTEWTQEQQEQLEAALKQFPASLGAARWQSISSAVPGKSKRDCVERYKYLAELYKKK